MTEIGDGVKLGICAGKNRRVGNRRQRRLGIGLLEHDSLPGQRVQIRGKTLLAAQETHAIGAGGVHGDEDDVGSFRPDERACAQHEQEKQRKERRIRAKEEFTTSANSPCDPTNRAITCQSQNATAIPNCMLRGAPVPRTGLTPSPTSGVAKNFPKVLAANLGEILGSEHGMVQNIENFPFELHRETLAQMEVFEDSHIEL